MFLKYSKLSYSQKKKKAQYRILHRTLYQVRETTKTLKIRLVFKGRSDGSYAHMMSARVV